MDLSATFKYDVALSFLQDDEPLAQSIADALRETCSVFLYSERQRELAGKDGVDVFTTVFREEARVCVVLYRDGWGSTRWTRVEETALKDRAFDSGWDFLTVVALSSGAPVWLPKTKIWLGFERFGVAGTVAVIEARVREQGGEATLETARLRAERLGRLAAAKAEREFFLNSDRGVAAAKSELAHLRDYLKGEVAAMNKLDAGSDILFDQRDGEFVFGVSTTGSAITFGWSQQYSNTLRGSSLLVQEFDQAHRMGELSPRRREPTRRETWLFSRTLEGASAWHEQRSPDKLLSSRAMAEHFLKRFLDRAHRDRPSDIEQW